MREFVRIALIPALGLAAFALTIAVLWWMTRRDRRKLEMQLQLREMEQAIYEETLPEERREALRQYRAKQAEIRREARRRLGLPHEDGMTPDEETGFIALWQQGLDTATIDQRLGIPAARSRCASGVSILA